MLWLVVTLATAATQRESAPFSDAMRASSALGGIRALLLSLSGCLTLFGILCEGTLVSVMIHRSNREEQERFSDLSGRTRLKRGRTKHEWRSEI